MILNAAAPPDCPHAIKKTKNKNKAQPQINLINCNTSDQKGTSNIREKKYQ